MESSGKEDGSSDTNHSKGQTTLTSVYVDSNTDSKEFTDDESGRDVSEHEGAELQNDIYTERPISIKDYAYTEENPMHYGIYDDNDEQDEDSVEYSDYEGEIDGEESENGNDGTVFTLRKDDGENRLDVSTEIEHGKKVQLSTSADHKQRTEDILRGGKTQNTSTLPNNDEGSTRESEQLEPIIQAVALYPFEAENENELGLVPDQLIMINYEYGDGWLVAYDPESGRTGLIPSAYVQIIGDEEPETSQEVSGEKKTAQSQMLEESLDNEKEIGEENGKDNGKEQEGNTKRDEKKVKEKMKKDEEKEDDESEKNTILSKSVTEDAVVKGVDHLIIS